MRAEAERRGLAVADKPDSHDICFIADGDTAGFLNRRLGQRAGTVVDQTRPHASARTTGTHQFTVGQRRGLRLGVPADDGQPRYVLDISPVTNTVTVGPREALRRADRSGPSGRPGPRARSTGPWSRSGPAAGPRHAPCRPPRPPTGDGIDVRLATPATGVAPGQAVVLYDDTRVIGCATIAATAA